MSLRLFTHAPVHPGLPCSEPGSDSGILAWVPSKRHKARSTLAKLAQVLTLGLLKSEYDTLMGLNAKLSPLFDLFVAE